MAVDDLVLGGAVLDEDERAEEVRRVRVGAGVLKVVDELFDVVRGGKRSTVTVGAAVPGMATVAEGEGTACEAATSVATYEDAVATAMAENESEGLAASKVVSIATAASSLREAAVASYARAGGTPAEASAS